MKSVRCLRILSLCLSLALWGCSQHVDHRFSSAEHDPYASRMGVLSPPPDPDREAADAVVPATLSMGQDASSNRAAVPQELDGVQFQERLYLAKDGSLIGDFLVVNTRAQRISNLVVECQEYDPSQVLLRASTRNISAHTYVQPHSREFFSHIDFGYVDHEFETVKCQLQGADAG